MRRLVTIVFRASRPGPAPGRSLSMRWLPGIDLGSPSQPRPGSGRSRPMGWPALLPFAAMLALACGTPEGSYCGKDDDCDALYCFAGTCQELGNPSGDDVVFEVRPLPGLGLPPAVFPYPKDSDQRSQPKPLQLKFCSAAGVDGRFAGEGVAEVAIAGVPSSLGATRRAWVERVGPSFGISLPAGSWTLTFHLPESGGVAPPPVVRQVDVRWCAREDLDLIVPLREVREARIRIVVDEERDPRPRCGVSVRLVDPSNRQPLSRTLAVQQPKSHGSDVPAGPCEMPVDGWLLPFLPPTGQEVEVQIRSLDQSQPTIYHQNVLVPIPPDGPVDLGTIGVIGVETTLEPVQVAVISPNGQPVEGARIRLSPVGPEAQAESDAARWFRPREPKPVPGSPGIYETWALPGAYSARTEPPPGDTALAALRCLAPKASPGACGATIHVVRNGENRFEARLSRSLTLSGNVSRQILASEPRPTISNARVTALSLDGGRNFSTRTDGKGRYELLVDPGRYQLLVQPHSLDAPWARVDLKGPMIVDQTEKVLLPPPARVLGRVVAQRGAEWVPLGHSHVRAYRIDATGEAVEIGEAVADAEGRFALVLPAEREGGRGRGQ